MTQIKRDGDSSGIRLPCRLVTSSGRTAGKVALALILGLVGLSATRSAKADGTDPSPHPAQNRVDMIMYGRIGVGWIPTTGQVGVGRSMNLGNGGMMIGGRLEEGDYLQPGVQVHILKGEKEGDPKVDLVMDVQMFSTDGSILGDVANGNIGALRIVPEQAYIQAQNLITPGLTVWAGARLYRKNDVHIADYFYFDNLPAQGVGVMYRGLDAAILVRADGSPNSFYTADLFAGRAGTTPKLVTRQRTMFVAGYSVPFGSASSFVKGLAEFHQIPHLKDGTGAAPAAFLPADVGWALGAKLHLDLGNGNFNDASFKYGGGIANGAADGRPTFATFGEAAADGTFKGAAGIEVVEHFLWNVAPAFSLNGYATMHYDHGASTPAVAANLNSRTDFAVGVRPVAYLHKNVQLLVEGSFQLRKDDAKAMGTAVKLSVAPTLVPTGEPGYWTRPHIRAIYTLGLYNQAAQDQLMSNYLQTVGPTSVAHFVGVRAEWWF